MKNGTAPEFASSDSDGPNILEDEALTPRPPRDPSMDTLLEGLAGRAEPTVPLNTLPLASRLRARRPPEARTDPNPEPPVELRKSVVAESTGKIAKQVQRPPRPADPTVVVPRDDGSWIRLPAILLSAAAVLLLGVLAIWFRGVSDPPAVVPTAQPPQAPAPLASIPPPAPQAAPSALGEPAPAGVASAISSPTSKSAGAPRSRPPAHTTSSSNPPTPSPSLALPPFNEKL